ncbi:MAG: F0F1 ATP synthase subunit A, partial [Oscillospiraceae bacterium]|nr:F0F1 ATP synthase subunit A [Oscillospiraceae bacterium]
WILILAVTLFSILATRNMKDVPGKLQNVAELVVGGLRNYFTGTLGKELCDKYFPIFGTFFIFIIVSNYSGLLPGAGHFRVFLSRRRICRSRRALRSLPSLPPISSASGRKASASICSACWAR